MRACVHAWVRGCVRSVHVCSRPSTPMPTHAINPTPTHSHGLNVSFLPKPVRNAAGSGCHMHLSLWKVGAGVDLGIGLR